VSERYQRAVNNVSLAVPYIGVSNAVHDKRNIMPQSETSDSIKIYSLWASVPSLVMKLGCAGMLEEELAPIIYDTWNDQKVTITTWLSPGQLDHATTKNKTVVDDPFGWTKTNGVDYPPVFPLYRGPFNTVVNHTVILGEGLQYNYSGKAAEQVPSIRLASTHFANWKLRYRLVVAHFIVCLSPVNGLKHCATPARKTWHISIQSQTSHPRVFQAGKIF
jgi:hypothetical protein